MCRALCILLTVGITGPCWAKDAFYEIPLSKLKVIKGAFPQDSTPAWSPIKNYAVLDGHGEVFLKVVSDKVVAVLALAPKGQPVVGTAFVFKSKKKAPETVRFRIEPSQATHAARDSFYMEKIHHYKWLQSQGRTGSGWFRYQRLKAQADRLETSVSSFLTDRVQQNDRWPLSYEQTFQVFSGGRAISENLQLDRVLRLPGRDDKPVPLKDLKGITTKEFDWKPLLKGKKKPAMDAAAHLIPHDQHALFFRSFSGLIALADEAKRVGNPLYFYFADRSEDSGIEQRYQKQLCLPVSDLSRTFGPALIRSVAITGGDPYFRMGTDVAIVFEPRSTWALEKYIRLKQAIATKNSPGAKKLTGVIGGVTWHAVVTPRRELSSYTATIGQLVVVTNSLAQLRRLIAKNRKLAALPEYQFFRGRYSLADKSETAFLMISDATIRRWCGPRWRIADSRRTRMAAVLSHYHAVHLDRLVRRTIKKDEAPGKRGAVPRSQVDWKRITVAKTGPFHEDYNTLAFQTPISELAFDSVTAEEAAAYRRWRIGYQLNWRGFFDPIALRISLKNNRFHADLTVLPLIANTGYRELREITKGGKIAAGDGDPHPEACLHIVMAMSAQDCEYQVTGKLSEKNTIVKNGIRRSAALYLDAGGPWWKRIDRPDGPFSAWLGLSSDEAPIGMSLDIEDQALVGKRLEKLISGKAKPRVHNGRQYRKADVYAGGLFRARFLSLQSDLLITSGSEAMIKRALDRQPPKARAAARRQVTPWLGEHFAVHMDHRLRPLVRHAVGSEFRFAMQRRAWSNIPILNEWKRRYPKLDPLALHERLWHVRLTCPGGGKYVWNKQDQTMESTVYGHPLRPKPGPDLPAALTNIKSIDFGITFEHQGLRAKMQFERKPKP